MHNFSTPQHQYEHRGIGSPVGGGGDDIDGDDTHGGGGGGTHGGGGDDIGGDDTHGGGGGGTHGERDDTHGGGDDIQGNLMLFKTPPPLTVDPSIGDETLQEYLAVQDEREQRLKIRSKYMSSPYTDPFNQVDKESKKLMKEYSRFKRSKKNIA